jgi:hypothetical protein
MKYLSLILIFGILLSFPLNTFATTDKEIYELQERCLKSSDKWYERTWGSNPLQKVDGNSMFIYYSNHYNRKLKRCLVLEEVDYMPKGEKTPTMSTFDLRDINEVNKVFAHSIFTGEVNKKEKTLFKTNFGTICEVGEKKCNNWVEWESMIKPYMEE